VRLRARITELRTPEVFATIRLAILRSGQRDERFRILHFSVLPGEVRMIVEAKDAFWLSSGMRSVTIRIARYVNDGMGRTGPLWGDRWNGRTLKTPEAMRAALVEVLAAFRRDASEPRGIDPYSSAAWFDGFDGWQPAGGKAPPLAVEGGSRHPWLPWAAWGKPAVEGATADAAECPVQPARSSLARSAWREEGLIGLDEGPASKTEKPKRGRRPSA
jgi:hypothetical protein